MSSLWLLYNSKSYRNTKTQLVTQPHPLVPLMFSQTKRYCCDIPGVTVTETLAH